MLIFAINMSNFVIALFLVCACDKIKVFMSILKEEEEMKKLSTILRGKMNLLHALNVMAMAMLVYTANTTCLWAQNQPETPETIRKFRKF